MISVIIPTYNHAPELNKCLHSLMEQTYQDFEIIVVDDGSLDDPAAVVRHYSNIYFIQQPNLGAAAARNRGFDESQGEFVIFVDADVIMNKRMLELMQQALADNPDVSFVYCPFYIGAKTMRYMEFSPDKLRQFNYIHTSSLIRREDFPRFDEELKRFQDWDLWLTMVEQGKKGLSLKRPLFRIIKPYKGSISVWLPSFMYKVRWPFWGYTPKNITLYNKAKEIINKKHNLGA